MKWLALCLAACHVEAGEAKSPLLVTTPLRKTVAIARRYTGHVRHPATAADDGSAWVYFDVPEAEYLRHAAHPLPWPAKFAGGEGTVSTLDADFDERTGTIAYRATFPNLGGVLKDGAVDTIEVEVPDDEALMIPRQAAFDTAGGKFVLVIDDRHVVHWRRISVVAEIPKSLVVIDGLAADDKILLDGQSKPRDGSVVVTDDI